MVWGVPRALLQTHFIMCSPALHFIHDHLQGVLACLSIDLPCFDLTSCPASAPSARVAHPTHPHHHSQHRGATHVNIHIFMFKRCPARGGSLYGLNFSRISSYVYQSSPTLYLKLQPACGNRAEAIRITWSMNILNRIGASTALTHPGLDLKAISCDPVVSYLAAQGSQAMCLTSARKQQQHWYCLGVPSSGLVTDGRPQATSP